MSADHPAGVWEVLVLHIPSTGADRAEVLLPPKVFVSPTPLDAASAALGELDSTQPQYSEPTGHMQVYVRDFRNSSRLVGAYKVHGANSYEELTIDDKTLRVIDLEEPRT